ncbi:FAD-linked oxidase [Actinorhabdospora filicis]|uniref:FAD-linked oxidase n=1 Tax=Actinorhabdospora filicis TaxID=1785913 RepID=A0A9W6SN49_9ACTN|nr:FAD-binding protein [Actinorhabdospora filicis]GLZ78827.1 FAD-linked oxidase [Actinorhabdospora filicis]
MSMPNRRSVLAGLAAGAVGAIAIGGAEARATPPPAVATAPGCPPPMPGDKVGPGDTRYPDLVARGANRRFSASPDYVHLASTTGQVADAVAQAVRAGKRVAVRSGGGCFADLVDNPDTKVVIDLAGMTGLWYDPAMRAFAVEPGVQLGELYRRLFLGWGVTVPLGSCPEVGAGGHIMGGGHGAMSRLHGLGVDHLYAVEVVTVDASNKVRVTVATREPRDPNRDLWWAHTGGGGGNFGVVTRYWLRTPGATGGDPRRLLPRPPARVLDFQLLWGWDRLDHESFTRLVRQHGQWHAANSAPGSPGTDLHSALLLFGTKLGAVIVKGQVVGPDAERTLAGYVAALTAGTSAPHYLEQTHRPWLENQTSAADSEEILGSRFVAKTGYLRDRFTDAQIQVLWEALSADPEAGPQGAVWLVSTGGKVNAVAPGDTAVVQRDSVLKAIFTASGASAEEDAAHQRWVRDLYRKVYAATGGVPPHDSRNGGCYINYPDPDLADPAQNTSTVPWHDLYYGDNYARLQQVKRTWDPRNHFRHTLSVRLPN